jgi:chemotaxis signal transduction protein
MTTMVCFQSADARYCIPVQVTRGVKPTAGLVALPAAGSDVAGLVPGDPPLTVIAALGPGGGQILVVEAGDTTFGLLVDTVTGLRRIADEEIRPAPGGQARPLICGTVDDHGELILVADPIALASRL